MLIDKGVNEFISAAKIIKNKGIQARFILAGDLDSRNPSGLKAIDLDKIKREGNVDILGYHQDIPNLYSKSHIICLPSYRGVSALMEAAAAGRAVVVKCSRLQRCYYSK